MYNVSQDYIDAIKSQATRSEIEFEIDGVTYTDVNILKGSFAITNQCTDTSDIKLGAVYSAELSATLRFISIERNNWRGKVITPVFKLLIDEENDVWESVPLGIFTVSEANWSRTGISIKAYDNMMNFNKPWTITQASGRLYDYLRAISTECNVDLAQTEEDIRALPNGTMYFAYDSSTGVKTCRDLLSWIAQTLGGFATINRDGELEIRAYDNTPIDELGTSERLVGAIFSDYITSYTAISYYDINAKISRTFSNGGNTGATMTLGANPFLQVQNQGQAACENLLDVLAKITYVPFKASNTVRDPAWDLGDCLTFVDGLAGEESLCCIQRYNFKLHNKYEIQGYGADPSKESSQSKTDKSIQGLLEKQDKDAFGFYEVRNLEAISIPEDDTQQIVRVRLASNALCKANIHIEVNLETVGNNANTEAKITYIVDGSEDDLHPTETYVDGNHIMHLMYIITMQAGDIMYFLVHLTASGGDIEIDRQGVWLYAMGIGLVGEGVWDGNFDIEDDADLIAMPLDITVDANVTEDKSISVISPITITKSENVTLIDLVDLPIMNTRDVCRLIIQQEAKQRITEDGRARITEDNTVRYTEG